MALNYIELRSLQNRLQIAERNLAIQQENQQISEWRMQAGLATSLDVEQARASTAQTAAQILRCRHPWPRSAMHCPF